jgi:gas vesicle protein
MVNCVILARFYIKRGLTKTFYNMSSKYNEDSNGGFALGLLVGVAIGGLVGILFAPKSGSETRAGLKDLADQQKDKLRETWEDTKINAAIAVDDMKGKLDNVANQANGAVDTYADKAKQAVSDLTDGTKNTVDGFLKR